MKKFMMATAAIMLMAAVVTTAGCKKDSINGGDNAGILFNMRNDEGELELLKWDTTYQRINYGGVLPGGFYPDSIPCSYDYKLLLSINQNNNFISSFYYEYYDWFQQHSHYTQTKNIACVGSVKGLNKITTIPKSGWVNEIAVQPGNGYVIRLFDYDEVVYENAGPNIYARVYVEDWLLSATDNGILGVTIRYEDNWKRDPITK